MLLFSKVVKVVVQHAGICFMIYKFYRRQNGNPWPLYFLCWLSSIWRVFCQHAGGHRYFAHKSFRCTPIFATLMALTICVSDVGTFYYWVFFHNDHHTHCDKGRDLHSPKYNGLWTVQFRLVRDEEDRSGKLKDECGPNAPPSKTLKTKYDADLSWITVPVSFGLIVAESIFWMLIAIPLGFHVADLLLWICLVPRLFSMHIISTTNSFSHVYGDRPYCGNGRAPYADCMATNNVWVALVGGGEGWHNNHHAFALSSRHGMLWYEFDWCWLLLRLLAELGLVWDMIEVADEVRLAKRDPSVMMQFENKYIVRYKREEKKV